MAHLPSPSRLVAVAVGAALALSVVTACSPAASPAPVTTSTESESELLYPEIHAAVLAAEPRVVDTGILESQSGASNVLSVAVFVSGAEPLSTESLTAMLVAVRDTMPDGADQLDFIARDDTEASRRLDIGPAINGLPAELTPLWDGTLTLMRGDLDKL